MFVVVVVVFLVVLFFSGLLSKEDLGISRAVRGIRVEEFWTCLAHAQWYAAGRHIANFGRRNSSPSRPVLLRRDLPQVDADLLDNQEHIAQREETWPLVRPPGTWLAEWKQLDRQLQDGQGQLNYDVRAFRLTPDGAPRLFVRARWRIAGTTVFLMSAWFRADPTPVLLSSDSAWSNQLRQGKLEYSFLDLGDFQSI